jgi:hypothetical protein
MLDKELKPLGETVTGVPINEFIPIMEKCGFDAVDSALFFLGKELCLEFRTNISSKTKKLVRSIVEMEDKISETHNQLDRKIYNIDLELAVFLFKKSFAEDIKEYVFDDTFSSTDKNKNKNQSVKYTLEKWNKEVNDTGTSAG